MGLSALSDVDEPFCRAHCGHRFGAVSQWREPGFVCSVGAPGRRAERIGHAVLSGRVFFGHLDGDCGLDRSVDDGVEPYCDADLASGDGGRGDCGGRCAPCGFAGPPLVDHWGAGAWLSLLSRLGRRYGFGGHWPCVLFGRGAIPAGFGGGAVLARGQSHRGFGRSADRGRDLGLVHVPAQLWCGCGDFGAGAGRGALWLWLAAAPGLVRDRGHGPLGPWGAVVDAL